MASLKAPDFRSFRKETGEVADQSSQFLTDRAGQLGETTTNNLSTLLGALTTGRSNEVASNRRLLQGSRLRSANRGLQRATQRLTRPTQLSRPITTAAQTALTNPTAGNQTLGRLTQTAGPSELLSTMTSQAQAGLADDGQLSPEEERLATQGSRAAFAARGLGTSNPAALAEVLGRVQYVQQRQDRARDYATRAEQLGQASRGLDLGVAGLEQDAINSGRNFALGANAQEMARDQFVLGAKQNAANFALQTDPQLAALNMPSMLPGALSGSLALTQQSDVFPQLLAYGSDVNNTNFNAAESRYLAELNRRFAQQYGGLGMLSGGGGGFNVGGAATGALTGAATGAMLGSVVPGIGTAVGAAGGAILGGVGGGFM